MNLASRIKLRMAEQQLRSSDLVELMDVSKGTISQWINDITQPRSENLLKLADSLSCRVDWLMHGKGEKEAGQSSKIYGIFDYPNQYPLLSWLQAGALSTIDDIASLEAEKYSCPVKCSKETFILVVQGVSMEPIFREGELIFVDPQAESSNGSFVVARHKEQDEVSFKQLVIEQDIKYLKPANPNWPEQITPIKENCTIVGTVIFSGKCFE